MNGVRFSIQSLEHSHHCKDYKVGAAQTISTGAKHAEPACTNDITPLQGVVTNV